MSKVMTKKEFIALLKSEGVLPVKMFSGSTHRECLDRVANDQVFSDMVDCFIEDGKLPPSAIDWALSYAEGGA